MNKEWHEKNRMPENASLEERIEWHEGHATHCDCRDSKELLEKLKTKYKNIPPSP